MKNFKIVNIWPIYQCLDKRIWFIILFFILKWVALCSKYWFFLVTMTYFVPIRVIKGRTTKMYPKCFNGKLWPYHFSCFISSFLYDPKCKAWLFEKVIFELKASYSFKTTYIMVRQVIYLKKIGGNISRVYCLVSWSAICTPLIFLSALMKRQMLQPQ